MPVRFNKTLDNRYVTLSGQAAANIYCIGVRIRDGLSKISEARMEFFASQATFKPHEIVGQRITLTTEKDFKYSGLIISVEEIGYSDNDIIYAAEIRPWFWLATLGKENRIYQGKTTFEILKDVCYRVGFTDVKDSTSRKGAAREYCVQYGESNFAFLSRLLEEEGYFYYFDHSGARETLVIGDSVSASTDQGTIKYVTASTMSGVAAEPETIQTWTDLGRAVPKRVSMFDYDPLKPASDLKVTAEITGIPLSLLSQEVYHDGGHYLTADAGEASARRQAEANTAARIRARGVTNHPKITTGSIFTLDHADRSSENVAHLVVGCTHLILGETRPVDDPTVDIYHSYAEVIDFPDGIDFFRTEFEVQRSAVPFRPQCVTPWPAVPGLLTAVVSGPDGEEIHTDEHGRIKVRFPWDRGTAAGDATTCWVRVVMPWAGKGWGWQSIPRIGMEVIIQFERGNIDRPYCTGMVYNGVNTPPFALPDEMTKTGLRTNVSKGGGGFHELSFDDKKDAEAILFQSEKDYTQIIKNNATITIGMEKQDEGSLTQTIFKNKTEVIKEGDLTQTVEKGNRITAVKTDDTTTIEGKSTTEITGDTAMTIKEGNLTETIKTGNAAMEVSTGNLDTVVKLGNITIDATAGKVVISAAQGIELKVGGNSLKIDVAGVTVTGTMVTVDGKAMTEVKGPMVKVAGSAMTQISGAIVMVG